MQKNGNNGGWPELLRNWRAKTRMTQREAAEYIGIPYNTYVSYENGRREPGDGRSGSLAWMTKQRPTSKKEAAWIERMMSTFLDFPEEKKLAVLELAERILRNED